MVNFLKILILFLGQNMLRFPFCLYLKASCSVNIFFATSSAG